VPGLDCGCMLVIYCLQIKAPFVPGLHCGCTYTVAGGRQGQEDGMDYLRVDACGETILIYMYRGGNCAKTTRNGLIKSKWERASKGRRMG
jgi:hypothetical protein